MSHTHFEQRIGVLELSMKPVVTALKEYMVIGIQRLRGQMLS